MNNDNYNNKKDKLLFLWLKPLSPFASLIGGVYRHDTEVNPAKSYNILNIFSLSKCPRLWNACNSPPLDIVQSLAVNYNAIDSDILRFFFSTVIKTLCLYSECWCRMLVSPNYRLESFWRIRPTMASVRSEGYDHKLAQCVWLNTKILYLVYWYTHSPGCII